MSTARAPPLKTRAGHGQRSAARSTPLASTAASARRARAIEDLIRNFLGRFRAGQIWNAREASDVWSTRITIPAKTSLAKDNLDKEEHRVSRCGLYYDCPDGACGPNGCEGEPNLAQLTRDCDVTRRNPAATDSTSPATRVTGVHLQAPNDLTPRLLATRQPTSSTHTSQREAGPTCP